MLVPETVAELAAAAFADAGLPPPQPASTSAPAAASVTAVSERARPDRTYPDRAVSSDILVIPTLQTTPTCASQRANLPPRPPPRHRRLALHLTEC